MPSRKVLVIEDDVDIVKFLITALETEGYDVVLADNRDAAGTALSEQPDVVLLDLFMPGLDGAAVSRVLRREPKTAHMPIIGMTALRLKAEEMGMIADDWLVKPFNLASLYSTVERWVRPG
jgi:DNA-binding response OmpR family regulator